MQIKIGSLVMWNKAKSKDYGSVGLVTHIGKQNIHFPDEGVDFYVLWTDGDLVEYTTADIELNVLKVVNF